MGFRDYKPELNRFTTRDMYNGALADMGLGADPYTGNRYAFTGGNPISHIELHGHDWWGTFTSLLAGGTKTAAKRTPIGLVGTIMKNILGLKAAPSEEQRKSEIGEKPNYNLGYVATVDDEYEYRPHGTTAPANQSSCRSSGKSIVYYEPLKHGKAQGVHACLNYGDFNYKDKKGNMVLNVSDTKIVGTPAPWKIPGGMSAEDWENAPKGFRLGAGLNRAHMLARSLGGSGTDRRNLVTMHARANQQDMKEAEAEIFSRLKRKETIFYSSRAIYDGPSDDTPDLSIFWYSVTTGEHDTVPIHNMP